MKQIAITIGFSALVILQANAAEQEQAAFKTFERITKSVCLRCHSGGQPKAGLNLSSREGLLVGGDSGPAIDLTDADSSLLLRRVAEGSMPPIGDGEPLSVADVDQLRQWIQFGAPWPEPRANFELQTLDVKEHSWVPCQPARGRPCENCRRGVIRRRLRMKMN